MADGDEGSARGKFLDRVTLHWSGEEKLSSPDFHFDVKLCSLKHLDSNHIPLKLASPVLETTRRRQSDSDPGSVASEAREREMQANAPQTKWF